MVDITTAPQMGTKNYAVAIKNVTPFDKSYSIMAEVYGFYDKEDPTILHQIEPSLVNLAFARDSKIVGALAPKVRLLVPALGIAAEGREINSKRTGTQMIYSMIGVHTSHIEVLNMPELKQDIVKKSEYSAVMTGADVGLLERIVNKVKAWV